MKLPFAYNALEGFLDAETVETHYSKHHAGYVKKLNTALEGTEFADMELVELLQSLHRLPKELQKPVFNNGGQVFNHNLYWESLSPDKNQLPSDKLMTKIEEDFGSFEEFKNKFTEDAVTLFGSGWVFLSIDNEGDLRLTSSTNADSPIFKDSSHKFMNPIMTLDVWEHAYYLKYKNLRPDYINNFWEFVNWNNISEKFQAAVDKK